jgi:alkyl hydroperoxide reductase subunit AhpC
LAAPTGVDRRPRDVTFVCPTELRAFAELHADFAAAGARGVLLNCRSSPAP